MDKNTLYYLWIKGKLPRLQRACLKSMLALGYKIIFYTLTPMELGIEHKNIWFKDPQDILPLTIENHLHYADLFRYKLLYERGGTWIDADMFLLKKIPNDDIIISSEHCKKIGAFSKQHTDKTPNIGVLRFSAGDPLLMATIHRCENTKAKLTDISFMKLFEEKIYSMDYNEYVTDPTQYCPVSWANYQELYTKDNRDFKSKWGMSTQNIFDIGKKSIGIHLWNNLYSKNLKGKIDMDCNSVFNFLETMVEDIFIDRFSYPICIPTYARYQKLGANTLNFLTKHKVAPRNIYIFCENQFEQKCYERYCGKCYNYVITNTKGIGQKRNFIRNYFPLGQDYIMMDDDVEEVLEFKSKSLSSPIENFKQFVINGFKEAEKQEVSMWGVCLFDNPFFGSNGSSTSFKFIGGTLQGVINNIASREIKCTIDHFEDIEFTILHYLKECKTLRYNNIGLKTKYYQPEGGICAFKGGVDKREEEAWDNGTYLIGVYPELCSLYLKSDGKLNIKLKDKRK